MVTIRPFCGYRYNEEKINLSNVVLPPYELTEDFQKNFIKLSPFNIIHIYLGKKNSLNNGERYEYSSKLFNSWIRDGILKKDEKPCLYIYSQEFMLNGKFFERTGFIALVELEELGKNIFPHEETMEETLINRRVLLEKTRANFGLIFSLYSDEKREIEKILEKFKKRKPLVEFFTEFEGVKHKLWKINDTKIIQKISNLMKNKKLLIADGHHRYKVSLEYNIKHPNDSSAKYISMFLVNIKNKGLVVLPTHRIVKGIKNFNKEKFLNELKKNFLIEKFSFRKKSYEEKEKEIMEILQKKDGKHFGLYLGSNDFYIINLKDIKIMDKIMPNHSIEWKNLDINILHSLILKKILNIDVHNEKCKCFIEYVKDFKENASQCIRKVDEGECNFSIFINPIQINKVKKIVEKGEIIPPKSTCFFPKVYCGLVIYRFDDLF
ncbi:MAG: DUF1015 domain-containing protein [Candidatus Aenigmatarchaeota archaeon]